MSANPIVKYLKKQSFQPTFASVFINPFFFIRSGLSRHIKKNSKYLSGELIDFGCGRKPYKNLFNVSRYVGVDIEVSGHPHELSEIDVFYDGKTLPFLDESFDCFFCSEVFEHLFNIDQIIRELHRVLRKGGKGLITAPFAWPEHEVPYDFGRYTSFGMRSLLEGHGFRIVNMEKSGHFIECLAQLSALFIYNLFSTKNRAWNMLCTFIFISPINIIGSLVAFLLPKKRDLFHNIIIVVEKVQ